MGKVKIDIRDRLWAELELNIQRRVDKKDRTFLLRGRWKKYKRAQDGFNVYAVDGSWIRNNLCCYFGHGGHGLVHEFIPLEEIWVSTKHYLEGDQDSERCNCEGRFGNQMVSKSYFDSTVIHEIEEFKEMRKGKRYWQAHQIALQKEIKSGLLKNIFSDNRD